MPDTACKYIETVNSGAYEMLALFDGARDCSEEPIRQGRVQSIFGSLQPFQGIAAPAYPRAALSLPQQPFSAIYLLYSTY